MNAIEIADMLAGTSGDFIEASILIRRQHAEIQEWRNVFGFLGTPDELDNEWNTLKNTNSHQHKTIVKLQKTLKFLHEREWQDDDEHPLLSQAREQTEQALADTEEYK
mgnify:CR=1 FL=1